MGADRAWEIRARDGRLTQRPAVGEGFQRPPGSGVRHLPAVQRVAQRPLGQPRRLRSPYDDRYAAGTRASYEEWYGKRTIVAPVR